MMLMAKQAGGQRHGTDRSARARRPVSIFFNHGDGDVVNLKMMSDDDFRQHKKSSVREIKIKKRAEVAGSRPDRHGPGSPWVCMVVGRAQRTIPPAGRAFCLAKRRV